MNQRLLVLTLFCGAFVSSTNVLALGPILPPIAEDIGSTVALVGQTASAALILGASLGLILGPVSDHYGMKKLLIGGALLMSASGIGTAAAFDYLSLLFTRIPAGIAGGILLGLGVSVANTRIPELERRSTIAWITGGGALAGVLGAPMLALLADIASWRVSFVMLGVLGVILAWGYYRFVPIDPPAPAKPFAPFQIFAVYRSILSDSRMVSLQVANLVWALVWLGLLTYFGASVIDSTGTSLTVVGLLFMWGGACYFGGNRIGALLTRRWSPDVLVVPASIVLGITVFLIFAMQPGFPEIVFVTGVMGFAGGLGRTLIVLLIAGAATTSQGSVMMLLQFTWGMGQGLGAAVGGLLIVLGGYPLLGISLSFLSIVVIVLALISFSPPETADVASEATKP